MQCHSDRLFAAFREGREKTSLLDANNYKNAGEIIDYLRIPLEEVAILLLNGRYLPADSRVNDGLSGTWEEVRVNKAENCPVHGSMGQADEENSNG